MRRVCCILFCARGDGAWEWGWRRMGNLTDELRLVEAQARAGHEASGKRSPAHKPAERGKSPRFPAGSRANERTGTTMVWRCATYRAFPPGRAASRGLLGGVCPCNGRSRGRVLQWMRSATPAQCRPPVARLGAAREGGRLRGAHEQDGRGGQPKQSGEHREQGEQLERGACVQTRQVQRPRSDRSAQAAL